MLYPVDKLACTRSAQPKNNIKANFRRPIEHQIFINGNMPFKCHQVCLENVQLQHAEATATTNE
jgi:hypothetical protein